MTREWSEAEFQTAFHKYVSEGLFSEQKQYYPRYVARYHDVLRLYAERAPAEPQVVLDIGGGQLGLMCKVLWGDDAECADIAGPHFEYLRNQGMRAFEWDLCSTEAPEEDRYDAVFFSEVIEHLPIPGYVPLERLKAALKPDGLLICTTPNLYRPRNVVFLIVGRQIFDYFRYPESGGLGHVLEYSADHLAWQLEHAGFDDVEIRFHQVQHAPNKRLHRALYRLGQPLFLVPRLRDNLFAVGYKPVSVAS